MTENVTNACGLVFGFTQDDGGSCILAYSWDHKYLGQYIRCTDQTVDSNMRPYGQGDCTRAMIIEYAHSKGRR